MFLSLYRNGVYQVRGVLLVCVVWGAVLAWDQARSHRWVRHVAMTAAGAFVCVQVAWNMVPAEERVQMFVHMPDVLKTLDVSYNLKSATSSSERVQIWAWTVGELRTLGSGSGSWKWEERGTFRGALASATCPSKSPFGRFAVASQLMAALFVHGVVGHARVVASTNVFLLASPLLCFTFPSERAEIVVPMALLYWSLQARRVSSEAGEDPAHGRVMLLASAMVLVTMGGVWNVAQHTLGQAVRGQVGLATLNDGQRKCIDWFPSDAAMNHIDLLMALQLHAAGEHQKAKDMALEVLASRPHSLTALKALWSMEGGRHDSSWDCSEFSEMHHNLSPS